MPNQMQLRSVPGVPVTTDGSPPDRAVFCSRAAHNAGFKPPQFIGVNHWMHHQA
jgi:hypothetical protein